MPMDLSRAFPDSAIDLAAKLATEGPGWSKEDFTAILDFIAQHRVAAKVPWKFFEEAGKVWAAHKEAPRLIEAIMGRFQGTVQGDSFFQAALDHAVRTDKLALFERLAHPQFDWRGANQAQSWRMIAQKSVEKIAQWNPVFWKSLPPEDQSGLYARIAIDGSSILEAMDSLMALHAQAPLPQPSNLVHGLVEGLLFHLIDTDWTAESDLEEWRSSPGWTRACTHVESEAVLNALQVRVALLGGFSPRLQSHYHDVCDVLLVKVEAAIRAPWLARTGLALPRARAADRQAKLHAHPTPSRSRARPRS